MGEAVLLSFMANESRWGAHLLCEANVCGLRRPRTDPPYLDDVGAGPMIPPPARGTAEMRASLLSLGLPGSHYLRKETRLREKRLCAGRFFGSFVPSWQQMGGSVVSAYFCSSC